MKEKHDEQHNDSMFRGAPASSFSNAESLRRNSTSAEAILWEELKGKKFHGLKFRRQHPVQLYIADFYCHKLKLVVEVDGGYHLNPNQIIADKERTEVLEELGLKVIRFTNEEILTHIDGVLIRIKGFIDEI